MSKNYLPLGKVAEMLDCTHVHAWTLCKRGDLPFIKVGAHHRVSKAELAKYMKAQGYPA